MCDCLPHFSWFRRWTSSASNTERSSATNPQEPLNGAPFASNSSSTGDIVDEDSALLSSPPPFHSQYHASPDIAIAAPSKHEYGTIQHMAAPTNNSLLPTSIPGSYHSATNGGAGSVASTIDVPSRTTSRASSQHGSATYSTLSMDLDLALLEWPENENKWFLPIDQFKRLVNVQSIDTELRESEKGMLFDMTHEKTAELIFERFSKLFVILLLLEKLDSIYGFLQEDIDDSHLPFEKRGHKFFSKKNPNLQVQCTKHWSGTGIREFSSQQWVLNSPIFEKDGHYVLHKNDVLPFTMDASRGPIKLPHGGFGEVSDVVIHRAHQFLRKADDLEGCEQHFAIKRLYSGNRSDFEREVKMLRFFRDNRHHSHLAELLATYEQGGNFYLIFPFAKCDLKAYWKRTPSPPLTQPTVGWLLHQLKGLASAVQRIHGYADTWEAQIPSNLREGPALLDLATPDIARIVGRHGDITPPNILWSDDGDSNGLLILADFGQMRQYTTDTEFRKAPENVAESLSYSAPEARTCTARAQTSRAYDIWSLGAVYMECVVWLLFGWEELCQFTQARGDTFYTLLDPSNSDSETMLNHEVRLWIEKLRGRSKNSKFIQEFLVLIPSMLEVDPDKRIRSGELNKTLSEMKKRAKANSDFLIDTRLPHGLAEQTDPSSNQETPLPLRPSIIIDTTFGQTKARNRSKYNWYVATRTVVRPGQEASNRAVQRWMKGAYQGYEENQDATLHGQVGPGDGLN